MGAQPVCIRYTMGDRSVLFLRSIPVEDLIVKSRRMWYNFPVFLRNIDKRTGAGAPNGSLV